MRKLATLIMGVTLSLLSFLQPAGLKAQPYTVGVPVDTVLMSWNYSSWYPCYPDYDFMMRFPYCKATGVRHVMIFSNVSPAHSIYTFSGDTIDSGDTLVFSIAWFTHFFYFPQMGSFHYDIKAIGTPQVAGELYDCGPVVVVDAGYPCQNSLYYYFYDTCTVLSPVTGAGREEEEAALSLFPSPAGDRLNINYADGETAKKICISDLAGRTERSFGPADITSGIDIAGLPSGVHIIMVNTENNTIMQKFIKQ